MPLNYSADGQLLEFTEQQIEAMGIETLGVEDLGSPVFTREVSQSTMRCEFLVNAEQLDNFCCFMLGGQDIWYNPSADSEQITRIMPQTLVYDGIDYTNFAAVKIEEARPHKFLEDDEESNPFPIPTYDKFKVKVLFQQLPYALLEDDFTTSETQRYFQVMPSQGQTNYISLPGGVMQFIPGPFQERGVFPDGVPVPYGIGRPEVVIAVKFKWWRVPYNAWGPDATDSTLYTTIYGDQSENLLPVAGSVNSTTFQGYPPGVLLFLNVEEELVLDPIINTLSWNLTLNFQAKWTLHNYLFAFQSGTTNAGNGNGYYFVNGQAPNDDNWYPPNSVPDNLSLFNVRDHNQLVNVGY